MSAADATFKNPGVAACCQHNQVVQPALDLEKGEGKGCKIGCCQGRKVEQVTTEEKPAAPAQQEVWLDVTLKVATAAFLALSFYTNMKLAALFFSAGAVYGAIYPSEALPPFSAVDLVACSQKFFEVLGRVKLPGWIAISVACAQVFDHLQYHGGGVYVPITAGVIGVGFGSNILAPMIEQFRKSTESLPPQTVSV